MTENQEKELFNTLGKLVTSVNFIGSDVTDIKTTLAEHSLKHEDHSLRFDRLDAKVDSVAGKVIEHHERLTVLERQVDGLEKRIH